MQSNELRQELAAARAETDALFRIVSPEALYHRPVSERHRLVFYLGHLDAFDWNLLARRSMSEPSFHETFDKLFERGIDPEPGHAPSDTANDWPGRNEIETYNSRTRFWIDEHLNRLDPELVQMAIEHRLMHAETLAYLMHKLPFTEKQGASPQSDSRPTPLNPFVRIEPGTATLGKAPEGFGWDNEYAAHLVHVPGFAISRYKITNGEYLHFVNAGGSPSSFWCQQDGRWFWRGMFGLVPLPLAWPVWVTWEQASAYAKWRGASLPTEAQWHRASDSSCAHNGNGAADNFGFRSWDPSPVNSSPCDSPQQLTGNGWEWTRDLFAPFNGFTASPFYPGYSSDFFDNKHYVLKGASPRTAALLTRPSFRNWFRPEYPHVFAGFRLVKDHGMEN